MQQSATGWMTCGVCNASYESEIKLREHQTLSHRRGSTESLQPPAATVQSDDDPRA